MVRLQSIGKMLSDTAKSVTQKAAEAAELSKMNGQLSDINQEIERLYGQVGKAYYTARGSKESFETADAFCERIDSLRAELSQMQRAIDKKRNRNRCAKCGATLTANAKFCVECGTKVEQPEPEEEIQEEAAQPEETPQE
ncbi:MAG: zinc-ribbon domain-containing protein [Christensenellales bacterium]|jgi:uncharacterized coiled-coil DUF342 family protein